MAFKAGTCEETIRIQLFLGETIACDIKKVKRMKGGLNNE